MSVAAGGGDSLTRTTLPVGAGTPGSLVGDVIRALQRVPGVLLAEINAAHTGIVIAHDGAVPVHALLSAAKNAGLPAGTARGGVGPAAAAPVDAAAKHVRTIRTLAAVFALSLTLLLAQVLLPDTASKRLIIYSLSLGTWICFLFGGVVLRRKP